MTVMNLFPEAGEAADDGTGIDEAATDQNPQSHEMFPKTDIGMTRNSSSAAIESQGHRQDSNSEQSPMILERIGCSCFVRMLHRINRLTQEWPRVYALIFKVILPLFSLIIVSLIFGYWIAQVEAPEEIKKNNMAIAVRESVFHASQLERIVMREGPSFCVQLFFEVKLGSVNDTDDYMARQLDFVYKKLYRALRVGKNPDDLGPSPETTSGLLSSLGEHNMTGIDDIPEFLSFIATCGKDIDETMNHTSVSSIYKYRDMTKYGYGNQLSFNWIKCPVLQDGEIYTRIADGDSWSNFVELFRLGNLGLQENFVVNRWRNDNLRLFDEYYKEYQANMTLLDARDRAMLYSFDRANGFDRCLSDPVSAAWFWFVVMTTVGYGNASPVTDQGRAMVFTFGFLCMLLFGTVLAKAGDIVTTIFEDVVSQYSHLKLRWLTITWIMMIFWGVTFYAWTAALAAVTMAWKKDRVGEEMNFKDAYWFAFNSITTVGLGDFYIGGEAIAPTDVVLFAMIFLVGFVLLANFLTKLRELLGNLTHPRDLPKNSDE